MQESLERSSCTEAASLTSMPIGEVERRLKNYVLLLLTIGCYLPSGDVNKLKTWANTEFGADNSVDIREVFQYLEQTKVIGPTDLNKLKEFFWEIQRIEFVHLIDCFLSHDYDRFHKLVCRIKSPTPQTEPDRTLQERPSQSLPLSVNKGAYMISPLTIQFMSQYTYSVGMYFSSTFITAQNA